MSEWDALLDRLREYDTPTICNAAEMVDGRFSSSGFSTIEMRTARPGQQQVVGFARTAHYSGGMPSMRTPRAQLETEADYYDYVENGGPKPSIAMIQDVDTMPNRGCFWGEVNTNIRCSLGAIAGITNGGIRDVHLCAEGFALFGSCIVPAHGHDHLIDFGTDVTIGGILVRSGDIVHADQHGFIVLPPDADLVADVADAAQRVVEHEAIILEPARARTLTAKMMRDILLSGDEPAH